MTRGSASLGPSIAAGVQASAHPSRRGSCKRPSRVWMACTPRLCACNEDEPEGEVVGVRMGLTLRWEWLRCHAVSSTSLVGVNSVLQPAQACERVVVKRESKR